nr:unnamed protein product [Callosobruchus analis]
MPVLLAHSVINVMRVVCPGISKECVSLQQVNGHGHLRTAIADVNWAWNLSYSCDCIHVREYIIKMPLVYEDANAVIWDLGQGKIPKKRALWSEEQLQQAMKAVRCGMAVRAASNEFGIPRRTLRNHVSSGSAIKRIGRPCILTEEQEMDLESRIVKLADVGMPITYRCLRRSVYRYVEIMKIPDNFPRHTALAGRK